MSIWTHVNASIRYDYICVLPSSLLPTERELGQICRFEDETFDHWETSPLPCGREGSLEYKIIRNPDPSQVAAMLVVFWGDLRDFDDSKSVLKYFENITKDRMIRSGILEITIEGQDPLVYRYHVDAWKLVNEN